MLKNKEVTIEGIKYEVRELSIGQFIDILPRLTGDESQQAQLDMLKLCVFVGEAQLGEAVASLGVSAYMPLINAAMDVNGLGNEQ